MKWFIYALKNAFNYQGRASRSEFGWFMLIGTLLNVAIGVILAFATVTVQLGENLRSSEIIIAPLSPIEILLCFIYCAYQTFLWIAFISLVCRRLHDLGYSGWWQFLLYYLLPIGILIATLVINEGTVYAGNVIVTSFSIYVLLLLAVGCLLSFKDGQPHTNKYGEVRKVSVVKIVPRYDMMVIEHKKELKQFAKLEKLD